MNLVKNPSFEECSYCPDWLDEVKYASHWTGLDTVWSPPDWAHVPFGVPDLCSVCSPLLQTSVPVGMKFFQVPRTGACFSQMQMFYDETDVRDFMPRDYLQGHLRSTLLIGQSYCVSFYVSLANMSDYAVDNIAAYFDDGTIDTTTNPGFIQTHCSPQVSSTTVSNDTLHWMKIQGSFIAAGNERLITIGNFKDRAHNRFIPAPGVDTTGIWARGGGFGYYLVDDVSVMAVDATINAGADRVITGTDSVTIGDTLDSYLPTYWYANGRLIDSNTAWLRVRPDTTTMYVVELSRCGGDNITDTVWVYVGALVASPRPSPKEREVLLPNPAQGIVTVSGAAGGELFIYDMVGREVLHTTVATAHEGIDISSIAPGLYMAQVVMPDGGRKCVRLVLQ